MKILSISLSPSLSLSLCLSLSLSLSLSHSPSPTPSLCGLEQLSPTSPEFDRLLMFSWSNHVYAVVSNFSGPQLFAPCKQFYQDNKRITGNRWCSTLHDWLNSRETINRLSNTRCRRAGETAMKEGGGGKGGGKGGRGLKNIGASNRFEVKAVHVGFWFYFI